MAIPKSLQVSLAAGTMLLAAATGARADAQSEEKRYAVPEIVVTATRIEWPADKTASFLTVMSRADIERRHAESVGDLLRTIPGLDVVQSGSRGKASSLFIRGANSNQVLVLIDGVPANDPTTGAFNFSELSPVGIERIEIVRGPHGVLYGSSAIGGVVNIITEAEGEGTKRSASVSAGSYRSAEGAIALSGGNNRYRYSSTLSGARTDGTGSNDYHHDLGFSGGASARITDTSRLSLSLRYNEASDGLRGPSFAPDPNASQNGGHFIVSAAYKQFVSDAWSSSLRASFLSRDLTWNDPMDDLDTGPFTGDGYSQIDSRVENVAWQNDLRFPGALWLVAGAEWREERTTNSGYSPFGTTSFDDRIRNASLFANAISDASGLPTVSAGVRLDDHSEFGAVATYKVSLSCPVKRTGTVFKGSVGTGFRAPSLNELYYPGYGNPGLAPERTIGYDVGARQDLAGGRASLEAAWFDNRYRDMIATDPATWLAANIGEARSSGVEVHCSMRPVEPMTLTGFYAYTRTEDLATGKELLRRPRHSGGGSVSFKRSAFDVSVSASLVGARLDNDFGGPHGEYVSPSYTRVDAAVNYRAGSASEIFCTVANFADERYDEVAGYPAPGFRVMLGTKVDL